MGMISGITQFFSAKTKLRFLSIILIAFFFVFFISNIAAKDTIEISSSNDFEAPNIEHDLNNDISKDKEGNIVLKAKVTDEFSVSSVFLYFRDSENNKFRKREMRPAEDLGKEMFRAIVPKDSLSAAQIEYYFEASDKVGNKKLKGLEFSPLKKELVGLSVLNGMEVTNTADSNLAVENTNDSSDQLNKKEEQILNKPMVWVPGL